MASVIVDPKSEKIIDFLATREGSYLAELSRELELSKATIAKRLKGLRNEGYLEHKWIEVSGTEASTWIKKISIKKGKKKELLQRIK